MIRNLLSLIVLLFLAACSQETQSIVPESQPYTPVKTTQVDESIVFLSPTATGDLSTFETDASTPLPSPGASTTVHPTLAPDGWMEFPVLPDISPTSREIYQRGLAMGNDPQRFSKVGDCQNVSSYFLGIFEHPAEYELGPDHAQLQETIDYYAGSFSRESYAVKGGYNVAAILTPMRADPKACSKTQSPLDCELQDWQPSIALVSLEEWWADRPVDDYAAYLDRAVTVMIDNGTLPVLATRAGNTPHVYALNDAIARTAYQHDIPLWNFWRAIQHLPNRGLTEDGFHLTFARSMFNDPLRMKSAWPWRNLTALQVLDVIRMEISTP